MTGLSLSLGLSLTSLRHSGGTPTPTPTPTAATLIYDATAKQFVVTNAASFPGAVWAWKDETGTVVAGQTGSTLAYALAPAGLEMQAIPDGVTASASNWALAPVDLPSFVDDFNATDGTNLNGYNGWTSTATGVLQTIGGSLVAVAPNTTQTRWYNTGAPVGNKRLVVTNWYNAAASNDVAKATRDIGFDISPDAKYRIWFRLSKTGFNLFKVVNGVTTELVNSTSGSGFVAGVTSEIAFTRIAGRVRAYYDGNETPASVAAGGWLVSEAEVPSTNRISLESWATADIYPYRYADKVEVFSLLPVQFGLASATFASGAMTSSGTCTASVTNYDWALIGADGKVWQDWTSNVAVSGSGTWSISGAAIPVELEGHRVYLALRPSSNKANLILLDCGAAPVTPVIAPYVHGINEDGNSVDTTMMRERNLFGRSNFRTPEVSTRPGESWGYLEDFDFAVTGFDETGQYLHWPAGVTYGFLSLGRGAKAGIYDITYPASLPSVTFEMGQMVNVNVISAPSGGTARIEITQDYVYTCLLKVSGTIPAGVSIGSATIACYAVGETDKVSYLSDAFKAHMTAGNYRAYRNMTPDLGGVLFNGLVNRGSNAVGLLSPKAWGEISHLNGGTNLQPCIPHLATETWIEDYAAALRDEGNIHPAAKIGPENSNEVWNYGGPYVKQYDWHMFEGCKRGYFSSSGPFIPIPGLLRSLDSDAPVKNSIVERVTGVLKQPLNAGDYLLFAREGAGWFLVQTAIARSIGDPVPLVSGNGWTLIADGTGTSLAQRRMYSERDGLIVDIFDSVFGAAKIQPIVAWKHGDGFAGAKPILDFGNLRQKMIGRGMMMTAPYWGPSFGDVTGAFPGTNTPYTNWGPTQRALISTDPTAFKNAFFVAAPAVIDAMVNSDVTYRNNLDQYLVNNGELPGSIAKSSYEIFWEVRFGTSWPDAIKTVYGEIMRDARMGALMTRQAGRTRDEIGGHQMWFTRGGRIPTNFVAGFMMNWGMAENEYDIGPDNARFTALAAVGAA